MTLRSGFFISLIGLLVATAGWPVETPAQERDSTSVLVFSKTNGFRHASIPTGIRALREMGQEYGFRVAATEDSTIFREDRLTSYDVVVFLNTTGNVLGPRGQRALRSFVQSGRGFVGIHSASDTEFEWNWYGRLVGAYFEGHPPVQKATVTVEDPSHPSTNVLPSPWRRRDEWYNFRANPRDSVQVLLTLDESTYDGGKMGPDHPIAWCQTFEGGRSWYTAGGHTTASYRDPLFRQHLLGGLRWAAGLDTLP